MQEKSKLAKIGGLLAEFNLDECYSYHILRMMEVVAEGGNLLIFSPSCQSISGKNLGGYFVLKTGKG